MKHVVSIFLVLIFALSVALVGCSTPAPVASESPSGDPDPSAAQAVAPSEGSVGAVTFDIISHVFEYHDSVVAVVLNLDKTVKTADLSQDTFKIHAKMTDSVHDDKKVLFDGDRTITDIYANASGTVGDKGDEGNYIVIELKHGPLDAESVICHYRDDEYFQSVLLDMDYQITQTKDVGTALPLSAGVAFQQGKLKTDTVDEFAYGSNEGVAYRFFTPKKEDGKKYPLVVWLHGYGERGTDNETTLRSNRGGVAWAEEEIQSQNPCYVMAAQASSDMAWWGEGMIDDLLGAIKKEIAANPEIDQDRVYITGVSSGGYGTWAALVEEPGLFAAAIPLAGAYTVTGEDGKITDEFKAKLDQLKNKPIYIIHGVGDPSVDIDATSNPIYEYLTETVGNKNVIYSRLHDVSYNGQTHYTMHNVEVRTFNHDLTFANTYNTSSNPKGDEALPADKADANLTPFTWLFAQKRVKAISDYKPLFAVQIPKLSDDTHSFNEFVDKYGSDYTAENVEKYNQERIALLESFHKDKAPLADVDIKDFEYKNGSYTGTGLVYRPKTAKAEDKLPIVVYLHGGGWTTLSKECYQYECAAIAEKANCVVFSLDYQLAIEGVPMTQSYEDCYAGLVSVAEQAEKYGADSSKIAVMGDSAGGSLAASVALQARDKGGPVITHQMLCYPAVGFDYNPESTTFSKPEDALNPYYSPIFDENKANTPPTTIVIGTCDFLLDSNLRYAKSLMDAGVEVDFQLYQGMPHGFIQLTTESGLASIDNMAAKLKAVLH